MFQEIDENNDGVLSRSEIRRAIRLFTSKFGDDIADNVDDIIARIDIDNSGTIDIKEFITASMNMRDMNQGQKLK